MKEIYYTSYNITAKGDIMLMYNKECIGILRKRQHKYIEQGLYLEGYLRVGDNK